MDEQTPNPPKRRGRGAGRTPRFMHLDTGVSPEAFEYFHREAPENTSRAIRAVPPDWVQPKQRSADIG